jgi:hypothetical protein
MPKNLIFTEQDFLNLFTFDKTISFDDFSKKLTVLNGSNTSGNFAVRSDLDTFVARVAKKDDRGERLNLYKRKLYKMIVEEPEVALATWFNRTASLTESVDYYFDLPSANILSDDVFAGRTNSKYGRICKNINFEKFYNTKKLYSNDFEYVFGLMKAMFEDFKLRNSLVGPAFFDHICNLDDDYGQFWTDFMMGCNRASIFNPATYKGILDNVFTGDTLFAPVMGWNAYQLAFYSSNFKTFVATDVIPSVVENGKLLQAEYDRYRDDSAFELPKKDIDLYLCPSEQLDARHNFAEKYKDKVDAVLFSPPYFDLEIYPSDDQSFDSFPDYLTWLTGYWEETVKLAVEVMRPGAKFGFVISNYVNKQKQMTTISEDMRDVVLKHLKLDKHYRIQWSAIAGSRQAKKTRGGNFEDLWVFVK